MIQASFLPVECDRSKRPPNSADAECIAIQSSTERRFLCKSAEHDPNLPATEWICASLARSLSIPVADFVVVRLEGRKDLMFGSVWEGGNSDWTTAAKIVSNPHVFSDAYAYDLAIHNVDRHLGNFLYLNLAGDIVVKLIDASRAFSYHGFPLPNLPMHKWSNTREARAQIEHIYPLNVLRAKKVLDAMSSLPDDWMKFVLQGMPIEWLTAVTASDLDRWWREDRASRITMARSQL